jgi:hypothetical protein
MGIVSLTFPSNHLLHSFEWPNFKEWVRGLVACRVLLSCTLRAVVRVSVRSATPMRLAFTSPEVSKNWNASEARTTPFRPLGTADSDSSHRVNNLTSVRDWASTCNVSTTTYLPDCPMSYFKQHPFLGARRYATIMPNLAADIEELKKVLFQIAQS